MFSLQFDRERIIHARGVDLSRGGLRCTTLEPIDLDATAFVMLRLDAEGETNTISLEARVLRSDQTDEDEYDVAIEFLTLYPEAAKKLDAYLSIVASD